MPENSRLFKELPNALGYLRGIAGILVGYFLLRERPAWDWIAFVLFTLAAVTDYLDGWVARKFSLVTNLGKVIDPTADKILFLIPLLVFTARGLYSPWWIAPIIFRESAVTFCRIAWQTQGVSVGAEKIGKLKFVVQVALVYASFFVLLCRENPVLSPAGGFFGFLTAVLLLAAVALTLLSGFSFFNANQSHLKTQEFAKFTSAVGVGFLPYAPGTWGSLMAFPVIFLSQFNLFFYFLILGFFLWLACTSIRRLDLEKDHDPGYVVIDELLGMMVTFMGIPLTASSAFLGFILFRIFDVTKPYPVRKLEALPGPWGVIVDDLGAGLYAWLILKLLF